jgi:hypothetical protein
MPMEPADARKMPAVIRMTDQGGRGPVTFPITADPTTCQCEARRLAKTRGGLDFE